MEHAPKFCSECARELKQASYRHHPMSGDKTPTWVCPVYYSEERGHDMIIPDFLQVESDRYVVQWRQWQLRRKGV